MLALLSCHGFFGALHELQGPAAQTFGVPVDTTGAAGEHASHDSTGADSGVPAVHLGHADYYAVLLLAATLLLAGLTRQLNAFRLLRQRAMFAFRVRLLTTGALHPPRGPTAPSLQVFRL